jgi:hypothetical protein
MGEAIHRDERRIVAAAYRAARISLPIIFAAGMTSSFRGLCIRQAGT